MILFKQSASLKIHLLKLKNEGYEIGFVPTMGALHQGHLSLIAECKQLTDITVCSIFINPTQFNDPKDFEKYPNTIGADIAVLEANGCDILFLPSVQEIYPEGTMQHKRYDLGYLEDILEGAFRPGHFQGVCQVVDRLLSIVDPHQLFLGQKDYQQCKVIERLITLMEHPVRLQIATTQREVSGLAMSSRNMRLTEQQKSDALAIYQSLNKIKQTFRTTNLNTLLNIERSALIEGGFNKVDYITIADANTLQPAEDIVPGKTYVALAAAYIGDVRLIDNMLLG